MSGPIAWTVAPPSSLLAREGAQLVEVYRQIRRLAPNANIVVLGYPRLFPDQPPSSCTVIVPGIPTIQRTEMLAINRLIDVLDDIILASTQKVSQVHYVDVASSLDGHTYCTTSPWVNKLSPPLSKAPYARDRPSEGQRALAARRSRASKTPAAAGSMIERHSKGRSVPRVPPSGVQPAVGNRDPSCPARTEPGCRSPSSQTGRRLRMRGPRLPSAALLGTGGRRLFIFPRRQLPLRGESPGHSHLQDPRDPPRIHDGRIHPHTPLTLGADITLPR